MGKRINLFLLLFCILNSVNAQQITGVISNTYEKRVAQILVKLKKENKTVAYTSSDENGRYSIKINKTGTYELVFSSMNYEEVALPITINNINHTIEKDITLYSKEVIELNEVIAISKRPITIRKDKIVFDADSFLQGNEEVIEDLLKKLPGITVDSEGTIKVGNQEIEKVMIENDDFFEKGYKIVTKNMSIQPVDKVELLQRYSNNKHLKGIEHSNKVALNLKLKKDAKNQWFGNLDGGLDVLSADFYNFSTNLMNFESKNKYYFLVNLNNIGRDVTGSLSHLVNPNNRAKNFVGDGFKTVKNIEKTPINIGFENDRTRINNEKLISLNAIFNPSERLKIKPILFFNGDELNFEQNSIKSYKLSEHNNFTNTEQYKQRNKTKNIYGKVDVTYDFNKTSTLEIITKFNKIGDNYNTNILFNNRNTDDYLKSDNNRFDQELQYTKKLDDSKVLVMQGRYIYDEIFQNYNVNHNYFSELINNNSDVNHIRQKSKNIAKLFGAKVDYLDRKINGNLLELSLYNKFKIQNLDNLLFIKENPLVNVFNYNENQLVFNSGYLYKWNEKLNFKLNLIGQNFHLNHNSLSINNNLTVLNPKVSIEYKPGSKHKIITNYSMSSNSTNVGYINSEYVLNNYNNLTLGLDKPAIFNKTSFFINYIYGKWTDKFLWNTFMFYNIENDYITSNNIVYEDFTLNKYFTFKDRKILTVNSTIDYHLKYLKSNIRIKTSFLKTNYANRINGSDLRKIRNLNFSYGLEFRSGFDGLFNFHIGTKNTHSIINVEGFNNVYVNNNSFLDTHFSLSKKFDIQSNLDYYYLENLNKSKGFYFFDFKTIYKLKENKLSISIKGRNLLNINTLSVNSITDISESIISYRLLPRFILAGLEYRF